MTTDIETQTEKEQYWNNYLIPENELDDLKKQINEDPLIPRKTKVMRIEFNTRYTEVGESMVHRDTSVILCKDGSSEDEELMLNGITSSDCCLMSYDIEGVCPVTNKKILYDLAIVRTEKPKEYWMRHFK
jgi:hypothetical protein